jgi:hypothetical protein
MALCACNPSTWEAKAGRTRFSGQSGLYSKSLSKKLLLLFYIYIYIYNYLYLKIRKATAVLDFAFLTSFAYPAPQSPLPWKSSSLHWNNTTLKLAFYPKIVSFVINMK